MRAEHSTAGREVHGKKTEPITMRSAIVHDWFQGFHGSERTVAAMLDVFDRDPDVLTFHAAKELLPDRLARSIRRESRVGRLPWLRQRGHDPGHWRWLLPYMPRYFARLGLDEYELVISSSHSCAIGVRPRRDALHVCYCYTPMRYVWLAHAERDRVEGPGAAALRALRDPLRRWDRRAAQRPDVFIAISSAVAERIDAFYGRESVVVHPPVALGDFPGGLDRDPGHLLWVHRLVSYKRPLEVAEAFRGLPDLRLTMIGVGPLEGQLRAALPSNVELRGWLPRSELSRLFATTGGFIHVGEEDFGITMVEALAAGAPVLACDRGGARDIVRSGSDGLLISDPSDPDQIRNGVRELMSADWDRDALRRSAERFSEERFRGRLTEVLRAHGAA